MDYQSFKEWQDKLPEGLLRLDDLNLYGLHLSPETMLTDRTGVDATNWLRRQIKGGDSKCGAISIVEGLGVRDLLRKLLTYFKENNLVNAIALPEDVYPVYFEIVGDYFSDIRTFKTYPELEFLSVKDESIALLIPNPLTPIGRSLSLVELDALEAWLEEYSSRYVLIDACYNFSGDYLVRKMVSDRLIELVSVSKLWLKPAERGWALSQGNIEGMATVKLSALLLGPVDMPKQLAGSFNKAWGVIASVLKKCDVEWKMPQNGYLSVIDMSYLTLLEKHKVAAVPASVFGSSDESLSVVSCLSLVKKEK